MEPVRNHRNKIVVEAARLHRARRRREQNRTLLEGPALIEDAVSAGCRVHRMFAVPDDNRAFEVADSHDIELVPVDVRALQRVGGTETPRGPIAVIEIPPETLDHGRDLLVSWGVSDPGNAGTLIRTAAAYGWSYAYVEGSADPWSPKTLRAGAGGQFQTAIKAIEGLSDLDGWLTVATVVAGGDDPGMIAADRLAVLVGEEASGLPEDVVAACETAVTIGTPGPTESLNAAVAAGIVVHELSKRSRDRGSGV